jgi:hypothetical protein
VCELGVGVVQDPQAVGPEGIGRLSKAIKGYKNIKKLLSITILSN